MNQWEKWFHGLKLEIFVKISIYNVKVIILFYLFFFCYLKDGERLLPKKKKTNDEWWKFDENFVGFFFLFLLFFCFLSFYWIFCLWNLYKKKVFSFQFRPKKTWQISNTLSKKCHKMSLKIDYQFSKQIKLWILNWKQKKMQNYSESFGKENHHYQQYITKIKFTIINSLVNIEYKKNNIKKMFALYIHLSIFSTTFTIPLPHSSPSTTEY